MSSTTLATIIDGIVALTIIAAATTLLALHDLSENTAIALFGVAVVQIGGSAKALLALHVPAPAAPPAPPPPAAG